MLFDESTATNFHNECIGNDVNFGGYLNMWGWCEDLVVDWWENARVRARANSKRVDRVRDLLLFQPLNHCTSSQLSANQTLPIHDTPFCSLN